MIRIVLLGAGGHAREVAEILCCQGGLEPGRSLLGFIDENPDVHGEVRDGLPILGDWKWFDGVNHRELEVISAVGSPPSCRRLVNKATALGLRFGTAVSSLAYVSPHARVGPGVVIFAHVNVHTGAYIGDHSILNVGATISHDSRIGAYCNINPGVHIAGSVSIGEGCYIGMGTTVIQERSIGSETVIGAGAVVITDLDDGVKAVGIPAKVINRA